MIRCIVSSLGLVHTLVVSLIPCYHHVHTRQYDACASGSCCSVALFRTIFSKHVSMIAADELVEEKELALKCLEEADSK